MLSWAFLLADPMATLETITQETTAHTDEAVFVARDGRRARRLRNVAVAAGVLAILWIVGLCVGMLGLGSLPGVAIVKGAASHSRPSPEGAPLVAAALMVDRDTSRLLAADVRSVRDRTAGTTAARRAVSAASAQRPAVKKIVRRSVKAPAAANAQASVNPAQRTRGWSRKGYAAPRGQLRKAAPPPPPATSRGRPAGRQKPLPAPLPPVPPGQAKKAAQAPPPPPPPPPKKG